MPLLLDTPWLAGPFFLLILLAGSFVGSSLRASRPEWFHREESSFKALEGAVLGLLALLIGFTFSMAVSRYDLHIALEIEEANTLSTMWARTGTLPDPQRTQEMQLLHQYAPVRLAFANIATSADAQHNLEQTSALQSQMWNIAQSYAVQQRDPVTALFLASVSETEDATEKRFAAFDNRIPTLAWAMLLFIGFIGSALIATSIPSRSRLLLSVLPIVVGVTLLLILDLDSPHAGFVTVDQQSMGRVAAQILQAPVPSK